MQRREFLGLVGAAVTWPLVARAGSFPTDWSAVGHG
jgi:hypothetical protein